jgi:hypothetical protein
MDRGNLRDDGESESGPCFVAGVAAVKYVIAVRCGNTWTVVFHEESIRGEWTHAYGYICAPVFEGIAKEVLEQFHKQARVAPYHAQRRGDYEASVADDHVMPRALHGVPQRGEFEVCRAKLTAR